MSNSRNSSLSIGRPRLEASFPPKESRQQIDNRMGNPEIPASWAVSFLAALVCEFVTAADPDQHLGSRQHNRFPAITRVTT